MKNLKAITTILILSLLFVGCKSKIQISKRQHRGGYYVSLSNNISSVNPLVKLLEKEKTQEFNTKKASIVSIKKSKPQIGNGNLEYLKSSDIEVKSVAEIDVSSGTMVKNASFYEGKKDKKEKLKKKKGGKDNTAVIIMVGITVFIGVALLALGIVALHVLLTVDSILN